MRPTSGMRKKRSESEDGAVLCFDKVKNGTKSREIGTARSIKFATAKLYRARASLDAIDP